MTFTQLRQKTSSMILYIEEVFCFKPSILYSYYILLLSLKSRFLVKTFTIMIKRQTIINILLFTVMASVSYSCLVPEKKRVAQIDTTKGGSAIDSLLAVQLGADEYGMKNYIMALLKQGPRRMMIDSVTATYLQAAHMANITRLADEGKLIIAGPFSDNTDLKGIYIFDVKTIEEAQKLCETDPAIKEGSLMMELHPWYGSAAMMQIPAIHNKIAKKQP